MTMNLFSSFNPSSIMPSWMLLTLIMIMMNPLMYWKLKSISSTPMNILVKTMFNQFSSMTKNKSNILMCMSILMMIYLINMMGLIPFAMPQSSHMSMTLSMSLPIWMAMLIMKMKNLNKFMSHFVPPSTPPALIPFMVVIETISLVIQPITLSVRLMANISAGHILMDLLAEAQSLSLTTIPMMMSQIMFTTLELGVALIQAYVFAMLLMMYMKS